MTETTKAWLAKYKISSHTVAAGFLFLHRVLSGASFMTW
jgi:hypothetical protein